MAVDTPVLERITDERNERECAVPSRMKYLEADEHNARIRATYARLINPESKIEDVFDDMACEQDTAVAEEVVTEPVEEISAQTAPKAEAQPYRVENARADSVLFRADSAINRKTAVDSHAVATTAVAAPQEDDNEDLRPTPTTIQYQTIGKQAEKKAYSVTDKHTFGKREKILVAVFVAVVVALLTLVIVNSAVISNLNAEISQVQDGITTVRGALAGVNGEIEAIIQGALGQ